MLKLVCKVTCKYQSARKLEDNVTNHTSQSKCNINDLHYCDNDTDDVSIVSSSVSKYDESTQSDNSDSTFHPVHDNDDERDNSCKLYDVELSQDVPPNCNMCSLQDGRGSNGKTDTEDSCSVQETDNGNDSSTEETYSDFRNIGT